MKSNYGVRQQDIRWAEPTLYCGNVEEGHESRPRKCKEGHESRPRKCMERRPALANFLVSWSV
jgi:hypothetical protein